MRPPLVQVNQQPIHSLVRWASRRSGPAQISQSWCALSRNPSLFGYAVGTIVAPRAFAPFSRILVISPLNGVCGRRERRRHVVMIPGAWRRIFDQHELFQEIETNDPAVYLESGNDRR
jgi:hypothetical protein